MKGLSAILGGLAGLVIVSIVGFILLSGHRPSSEPSPIPAQSSTAGTTNPALENPLGRVSSEKEKLREELTVKRAPFMKYLREHSSGTIVNWWMPDDLDALALIIDPADEDTARNIVENVIAPYARDYAFRQVRFYSTNAQPYKATAVPFAEASCDDNGKWSIYLK